MEEMYNTTDENIFINNDNDSTDVKTLAMSYMTYKIGEALNQTYFLVLTPVGVIGNILSFLVMVQKHNRHKSISLYISVLAVADTIALLLGFTEQMDLLYEIDFPPSQYWFGTYITTLQWTATLCSTLFITSMTFERFYSIVRPHKAAAFNTVKKAKYTIIGIVLFSILFNIPHLFTTAVDGRQAVPYGKGMATQAGQIYFWVSVIISFALPFVLLLIMNSFIIHKIRNRSQFNVREGTRPGQEGQGQSEGQSKVKKTDMQIFAILLLVTFSFLILTTPTYVLTLYVTFVDYGNTPKSFADFHLFFNIGHKTYYTNYGINFFLYVISGKKFRDDLVRLFVGNKTRERETSFTNTTSVESSTKY